MSIDTTLARIAAIETAFRPPQPATGGVAATAAPTSSLAAGPTSTAAATPTYAAGASPAAFSQVLGQAAASSAPLAAVEAARSQVGQAEMPPGSNDSPRIAEYRSAVAGAEVGPWCADFVSWASRQAGIPLGENGEGFQSVGALWEWAEHSGRAVPADAGPPQAGDLIVWGGEHVGIVESVGPEGTIHTVEGNSDDQVAQRTYPPGTSGATGYVRLG